jgi:hypothetical protein
VLPLGIDYPPYRAELVGGVASGLGHKVPAAGGTLAPAEMPLNFLGIATETSLCRNPRSVAAQMGSWSGCSMGDRSLDPNVFRRSEL